MSHAPGTYLGGVRTVEDIKARCRVDEETGCWLWSLSKAYDGLPKIHFVTPDTGKRTTGRGRRVALYLARGRDIPKGQCAYAAPTCHSLTCCNPDHCRAVLRTTERRRIAATGAMKGNPKAIAANRKTARARSKLTLEQVAEIRSSSETTKRLSLQYQVSGFTVWSIRSGRAWRDVAPGASVFGWRP